MKPITARVLLLDQPNFLSGFFMVLLFILVLLTIFGICYLYITSKSKERLALIEKGMDPNLARSDFLTRAIIISGGFALGLIAGDLLPGKYGYGPLTGFIFAGISLIVYNYFKKR